MSLTATTIAVGRITIAPFFTLALCPLAISAGALFAARVAVAALGPRTIGNDLGVKSSLAGKVGSRGIPKITGIGSTGSDRGAHQSEEPKASERSKDGAGTWGGHCFSFQLTHHNRRRTTAVRCGSGATERRRLREHGVRRLSSDLLRQLERMAGSVVNPRPGSDQSTEMGCEPVGHMAQRGIILAAAVPGQ